MLIMTRQFIHKFHTEVCCKKNIALCSARCIVLSVYILFGHFCAYFPIPFCLESLGRFSPSQQIPQTHSVALDFCNAIFIPSLGNKFFSKFIYGSVFFLFPNDKFPNLRSSKTNVSEKSSRQIIKLTS